MATIGSQIRAYLASRVATATGITPKMSPRYGVDDADFPAISIYSLHDKARDPNAQSNRIHDRIYTVAVEILAAGRGEQDATDDLAVQVRQAVLSDGTLGGMCAFATWASQEWGGKETQVPLAATLLTFSCHYLWRPGA